MCSKYKTSQINQVNLASDITLQAKIIELHCLEIIILWFNMYYIFNNLDISPRSLSFSYL